MRSKRIKALLVAAAIPLLLAASLLFASAGETDGALARVYPFDADGAYTEILKLPGGDDTGYALFLPAGCDRARLHVTFDCKSFSVDSKPIVSGETTAAFAEDKTVTVQTENGVFKVTVSSSENLPAMFITTQSGSLDAIHADKSHKEKARLTLVDGGAAVMENRPLTHIKGRGSMSWEYSDKRSYNIKFTDDTELLGMAAARKWALVSNSRDCTLMRNAIVYTAAKMTRLPYTVDFRFVDLYINGDYRGNYLLCERIEVGENRININDLEKENEKANPGTAPENAECVTQTVDGMQLKYWKLPNEPADVSGGYLLEYDRSEVFKTEPSAFMSKNGACMHIRSPEHVSEKEIRYLASLYDEFEQALLSPDGTNAKGRSYTEYIDVDSFVDAAVLNEFTLERDGGAASWYIYLPQGSDTFFAGPAWDFDVSMESADAVPDSIYLAAEKLVKTDEEFEKSREDWKGNVLLNLLLKREFADLVAERTTALYGDFKGRLNKRANELFNAVSSSAACDRLRWQYEITNEYDTELRGFIPKRAKALKKLFSDFDAAVEAEAEQLRGDRRPGNTEKTGTVKPAAIAAVSAGAAAAAAVFILTVKKKKSAKKNITAHKTGKNRNRR